MDEIAVSEYVVTCETSTCDNATIPIPISAPSENPNFVCGVCSQPITSIETVTK